MGADGRHRHSAIATIVCYNSAAQTARTLERVPPPDQREFDVLVVDDGSTDDTAEQIIRSGLPSIRHERNRGVGAAIKSGLRYALDHGYEIVCILAGNDKDDPGQIPKLLAPIRSGEADYVQGSRFAPGGSQVNTPRFRVAMIKVHARFLQAMTGFPGTDALNGFRAYRTSLLTDDRTINVWQEWLDGYEFEMYLHFKVLSSTRRVTEVGVSKTYPPRRAGVRYSHIRPIVDWWRILRPIPLLMLRLRQ